MSDVVLDLPPHLRRRLAGALETGLLDPFSSLAAVRAVVGSRERADDVVLALEQFRKMGLSGPAGSTWMQSIELAISSVPAPDLVWSGPEVPGLHARDTRRVFKELLGSAERSVWVCTYAFFDGPKAFDVLARRMEQVPALEVVLLLNIQRRRGDTARASELIRRFAHRFWTSDWPGRRHPRVYYDPRALDEEGPTGVLHAKAVVADLETVFITSANLTEAALDRNIEIGLLARDRTLALSVASHFQGLIDNRLLSPLPTS